MRNAAKVALLLVDYMNPLAFDGAAQLAPKAMAAAKATVALKRRCRAARFPAIYANDNFGRWDSQFDEIVRLCIESGGAAAALASLLAPEPGDISILKPRHSAFYGTPLEFLLEERRAETLIVTGLAADSCVLFTALDAFLRNFRVWVPRDCVASKTIGDRDRALTQMHDAAKVWTGPSRTPLPAAIARCASLHK